MDFVEDPIGLGIFLGCCLGIMKPHIGPEPSSEDRRQSVPGLLHPSQVDSSEKVDRSPGGPGKVDIVGDIRS